MASEIEAKFILQGVSEFRHHLMEAGGVCVKPRLLMRRRIYDYPDLSLDAQAAWVRIRDEGHRNVLSYKQRRSETLSGMIELETVVESFDNTCAILEAIGMKEKAYQENYREIWNFMKCEISLDEWPWIPTIVEIEGETEDDVIKCSIMSGMNWSDAIFDSIDAIYQKYYDVTRTEASSIRLTFDREPNILQQRRRSH